MRQTLRRACAACARNKHSCDRGTPRCSRCLKRNVQCTYANEPLTWAATAAPAAAPRPDPTDYYHSHEPGLDYGALTNYYGLGSLDPFDSYPPTRLPRPRVERLIHSFLNKIAFQYYPLDLNATSNPFLVSWWPLALGDPALFHVSLQTACLDEELLAQKGFQTSELLMADSVALLRRKVESASLALQDGTMNSVITLAAIEFGKGNFTVSEMHVDGVKKLVGMRGGIQCVRQTSPLTARMVSWVSMLVMGQPQFATQGDDGTGDGLPLIPEWQLGASGSDHDIPQLGSVDVSADVANAFTRLRNIFERARDVPLPTTRLHDLICFVVHRLLLPPSEAPTCPSRPATECVRSAIVLYMFIIQGPTYYSHSVILNTIVTRYMGYLTQLEDAVPIPESLHVWLLAMGLVASDGTTHHQWFVERARCLAANFPLGAWDDVFSHIKSVLWLETPQIEAVFRPHWDAVLDLTKPPPMHRWYPI